MPHPLFQRLLNLISMGLLMRICSLLEKIILLHLLFIFLLYSSCSLSAQLPKKDRSNPLEGYWEGAFIKENSYQKFDISFSFLEDQIMSLQILDEWHPQFGEFEIPVEIDSSGSLVFNTGYGKAVARFDTASLEIHGHILDSDPPVYVHFKKVANPPSTLFEAEEQMIQSGDISIYGHLHKPKTIPSKTAIIIVGGRGCFAGNTKYDLYAKLFKPYLISTFSYHKRGTGKSTGDCSLATIDDLASDLAAIKRFLEQHPNDYEHIGVLGSSAGAWVMFKASEMTDFDFMVSVAGPSTSVKEQQMDALEEGIPQFKLSIEAQKEIRKYMDLVFSGEATESGLNKMNRLLENAEKNGWGQLLETTDVPKTKEEISNLWVRRHAYNPSEALQNAKVPYLAMFGERDWIVPYKTNSTRLQDTYGNKEKLNIILIPNAEHGTEASESSVQLSENQSYWRFFRVSPYVQIELIGFLMDNGFIDR